MFEQTDISRHQCRRSETKDLPERKVPGHDGEHWTKRLEVNITLARVSLDYLICQMTFGLLRVVTANPGTLFGFADSSGEGLSHFRRHHLCEFIFFCLENLSRADHHSRAVCERRATISSESVSG